VLGTGNQGRPYFASFGRSNAVLSWGQRLKTRYNSLQVALNKPFTHGLTFKGAYTLSKSMNESNDDGRTGLTWNTPSELGRNYAVASFDRTHNFQMGFSYALPWQTEGSYRNLFKTIVSDWQLNGVAAVFSGTPYTVTASGTVLNTPGNLQTADLIGTEKTLGNIGSSGTYFDTSAFAQPTGIRFGNTGRNQFRGPGGWNLDFSVFRSFQVRGSSRLEFRVEAANIMNHAVFTNPDSSLTSPTFGVITGASPGGAYPERQVRLGLRFIF
jgi:hypothetical protein